MFPSFAHKEGFTIFKPTTGTVPSEMGNLVNMEWLDFYLNAMEGPIPTELGRLSRVADINGYGMLLNGTIPSELGLLASLRQL